jgi:hypothetical protein
VILLLVSLFACGEKTEDTGLDIDLEDTDVETGDTDEETGNTVEETGDTDEVEEELAIIGEYDDSWGGYQIITEGLWTSGSFSFEISQYSNEEHVVIAQNSADNEYNPSLWSKFQWTYDLQESLFYCQISFDSATEDDAISIAPANPTDLEAGCGGFGWTMLRSPLSISGIYVDDWGTNHDITSFRWILGYDGSDPSIFQIVDAHEDEEWLVAQNDVNNEWNSSLWSKFEWIQMEDTLYQCQSAFDADSIETALEASADRSDLAAGCDGYAWSELSLTE